MPEHSQKKNLPKVSSKTQDLIKQLNNPIKMWLYYLSRLPSLFWWGVSIKSCTAFKSEVTIPYGWRTQNPFKSIYFAAQAGAGEFSTGILALIALGDRKDVSMLVIKQEAEFFKKANSRTTFTCEDGAAVMETIEKALNSDEGHIITMTSIGRNEEGVEVSKISITWSFKKKRKKVNTYR